MLVGTLGDPDSVAIRLPSVAEEHHVLLQRIPPIKVFFFVWDVM